MSYPPLSAQALRYLQQLQQRLNASGSERVNTSVKTVQQVLAWCIEHELELVPGNSLQLPHFSVNLGLLNDIARVQRQLDAKGVSIALNEDYSAILLPDFATLQQHASPAMLPDKQLSFIAGVKAKTVAAEFQPYQELLCQQLKGLRQQNMLGMRLAVINLKA